MRRIYRLLVEAQLRCRQMTPRVNAAPTPSGRNQVWPPATGSALLPTRVYAGPARDHDRQLVVPSSRKTAAVHRHARKAGRRSRPKPDGVWSDAPAMSADAWCAKAQGQ